MSGQHCLLAEGDIGAPISTSAKSSVRLDYFHNGRLLTGLYKTETEIRWRKTTTKLKSKETSIATVLNRLQTVASLPNPLPFHYPLPLKVGGNEKQWGSGRSQILGNGLGPWRSRFIYNLNTQLLNKNHISFSAVSSKMNKRLLWH